MIVSDWRLLPAPAAAELYHRERVRWKRRLRWETATTWATVETGRVTWGLPGFVCHDTTGRVRGWTFYLIRDHAIEVGGLVAEDEAASAALVDALVGKAGDVRGLTGFVYAYAPGLECALAARALPARPFLYLVHDLEDVRPDSVRGRESRTTCRGPCTAGAELRTQDLARRLSVVPWQGNSPDEAARLLQRAYGDAGRIFAPNNELHEWQQYVTNLVRDPALGVFSSALSRVIPADEELGALAIVTVISHRTAHLAQIAVDPSLRRQGVAQQMLRDVLAGARAEGFSRVSLLVAGDNPAARALYHGLGFRERERFVAIGH